jgi:large subunit ribosomal protein L1
MPSPKAGTIAPEDQLPRLIEEAKAGRIDFRVDKTSNVHAPVGKVSFETNKLLENMTAFVEVIKRARPAAAKGTYIRKVTVADSMGPGVKVDPVLAQALELA